VLFPIGMFPFIMVVGALVFFPPSWPRRWLGALHAAATHAPAPAALPGSDGRRWSSLAAFGWACAAAYCAVQLVLPLRFLAYGGNVL